MSNIAYDCPWDSWDRMGQIPGVLDGTNPRCTICDHPTGPWDTWDRTDRTEFIPSVPLCHGTLGIGWNKSQMYHT